MALVASLAAALPLAIVACASATATPPAVAPVSTVPTVDTEANALRAAGGSKLDTFERDGETWYRGAILVDASAAKARKAILDYGRYSSFIHAFTKSVILARKGDSADVYLKVPLYEGRVVLWAVERFATPVRDGAYEKIGATMVRGNVADARAFWKFRPVDPNHSMVILELLVTPAFAVPASLVDEYLTALCSEAVFGVAAEAPMH